MRADLITVYHNNINHALHLQLQEAVAAHEPGGDYRFVGVDNRTNNRGFARACNLGALRAGLDAPIIGFLNPDLIVDGPFLDAVTAALHGNTVITGSRFGKPQAELKTWGVEDWVCGAAMFVQRPWFAAVHGFDEQFTWTWEESDLIRTAQAQNLRCQSITLPFRHQSPATETPEDAAYKRYHFTEGSKRYYHKWGTS